MPVNGHSRRSVFVLMDRTLFSYFLEIYNSDNNRCLCTYQQAEQSGLVPKDILDRLTCLPLWALIKSVGECFFLLRFKMNFIPFFHFAPYSIYEGWKRISLHNSVVEYLTFF